MPFSASFETVAHSAGAMLSVAPVLSAVAVLTHSGLVPLGTLVTQPLLSPVSDAVAKVYVAVVLGSAGAAAARW